MAQSFPHKIPTPPSSRPSSSRRMHRKSLRCIPQPKLISDNIPTNINTDNTNTELKKYAPLPAIGSNSTEQITHKLTSHKNVKEEDKKKAKKEPLDIAIKLSDGQRVVHKFTSDSSLMDVLMYLKDCGNCADLFPDFAEFVSVGHPQRIFTNLKMTLREANIKSRTLLYLRKIDPD